MISIDKDDIDEDKNLYLFFVTLNGLVKKTSMKNLKILDSLVRLRLI